MVKVTATDCQLRPTVNQSPSRGRPATTTCGQFALSYVNQQDTPSNFLLGLHPTYAPTPGDDPYPTSSPSGGELRRKQRIK